jgi:hypothetical protein
MKQITLTISWPLASKVEARNVFGKSAEKLWKVSTRNRRRDRLTKTNLRKIVC